MAARRGRSGGGDPGQELAGEAVRAHPGNSVEEGMFDDVYDDEDDGEWREPRRGGRVVESCRSVGGWPTPTQTVSPWGIAQSRGASR